jgi:hypothetical protein
MARQAGFATMSPLGFEITPDIEAEVMANPLRVPISLQTPERKAELLHKLTSDRTTAADRHAALQMLGGWDPDAEVQAALRPMLEADDAFVVGSASSGLARQGDPADLAALLAAVHRMSPSDGGTAEAMYMPLQAALQLAARADEDAVPEVKRKAREWLQAPAGARPSSRGPATAFIERLLE